jgi:DNA-binding LacI/PurR family transcriptional regulator
MDNLIDFCIHCRYYDIMETMINTKVGRIAMTLVDDIKQGRYQPGMLLPTERELAKTYEVSPVTMRKCLKILSKRGELVRHPQRGVVVASPAQAAPKVGQIAFVTFCPNDNTNMYAKGISENLDHDRFTLAVYSAYHDVKKFSQLLENVLSTRPAGVIINTLPEEIYRINGELIAQTGIPVVALGHSEIPEFFCDRIDESGTYNARKIAKFILKYQFRDIAYFGTSPRSASDETITAIRRELGPMGINLPEEKIHIIETPHGYTSPPDPFIDTRLYMTNLLNKGFNCELLIAGHDYLGVGALQALLKAGVAVPQQMKIISAMRCPVEGISPMKLTTIDFNQDEEGKIAIELLMRRINGYTGPVEVHHVAVELIDGETA